jgi:hypothetical protein
MLAIGAGMFGIFLFLTYYLQTTLGYSPVVTGVAFLPSIVMIMLFSQVSNIVLRGLHLNGAAQVSALPRESARRGRILA